MEVISRRECGLADWDALVETSPDGWVFALYDWQELILATPRWQLEEHSFALRQDGRLLAVVPLQYIASLQQLSSSGFGGSGPVLAPNLGTKQAKRVRKALYDHITILAQSLGACELFIPLPASAERSLTARWGVNPLVFDGFEDLSTHTCIIDLSPPEEELWRGLSETARHAIKKAQAAGYHVRKVDWDVDAYYKLHCETYERTGVQPHPREYFDGIGRLMGPSGGSVLFAGLSPAGETIAFHNAARHRIAAYYHTGCSATDHVKSGVNYLLLWESIFDAKAQGYRFFEMGEVFPNARDGKALGLSIIKSKFGGEIHRSFKGKKTLTPFTLPSKGEKFFPSIDLNTSLLTDDNVRNIYESGNLYKASTVCLIPGADDDYANRILNRKLELILLNYKGGSVLDLCCATGEHLFHLAPYISQGTGLDFSRPFIEEANNRRNSREGVDHLDFKVGDAKDQPFEDNSFSLVYSLSAVYHISNYTDVLSEIARVLEPGGVAILDMGNPHSLNGYVTRTAYSQIPPLQGDTPQRMKREISRAGLDVTSHYAFQLLPLWADQPRWLAPVLSQHWKTILKRRVRGRMIDEWISSMPLINNFAFRHLIVAKKPS